jgi:hypothetical protein
MHLKHRFCVRGESSEGYSHVVPIASLRNAHIRHYIPAVTTEVGNQLLKAHVDEYIADTYGRTICAYENASLASVLLASISM